MTPLRKVLDWLKYDRLHHYPALAAFDRPEALKRLNAYEREERKACQPWLTMAWILIFIFYVIWMALAYFKVIFNSLWFVLQIPGLIMQYLIYRRIRKRVEIKVAAELGDGRLWKCIECGYDLRASEDRCPECGTPVRVGPPA